MVLIIIFYLEESKVDKKTITILLMLIILIPIFSGCVENNETLNNRDISFKYYSEEKFAPGKAFFNEEIEFNATKIFKKNKDVKKILWIFGDGSYSEGVKVKHRYIFNNEFNIEYPLIYTVSAIVITGSKSFSETQQIKLYPREYKFYLDVKKLSLERPSFYLDKTSAKNLFNLVKPKELKYDFYEPLSIPKCNVTVSIYLQKPFFLKLNKIVASFISEDDKVLQTLENKLGFKTLWKEKYVSFSGNLDVKEKIKSIQIEIYGVSFGEKIRIIYGGEKPSFISFKLFEEIV